MSPCPNTEALIARAFEKSLLISRARAAALLGLDPLPLVRAGAMRAVRIGHTYRFTEDTVRGWLNPSAVCDVARLSARMAKGIRRSIEPNGRGWSAILGYGVAELEQHLARQFVDGMTWGNMAHWHIDHVRPLASFNITGPECPNFRAAWALDNLQPLWAVDNLRKHAKWDERE